MSAVAWTIERGGSVRPLAGWGIRAPRVTWRNLDVDEMTFFIPRTDTLAAPVFAVGDELILRRGSVGWFRGKVQKPEAYGTAKTEGDAYLVRNAWHDLSRTTYQQNWCINGVPQLTPRVTLGQNQFGQKISVGRQISEILTYALTKGVLVAPGALPEAVDCWLEEVRDLTCAGAIRKVLRLMPNAVGWCDYSAGGVPVLAVQPNDALAAVTLDATAGDTLAEFSGIGPRSDLVPAGVTFIYLGTERALDTGGGDGRTRTTITRDSAGAENGIGAIVAIIELNEGETAPAGLAAAYWAALQVVQWEGAVRLLEENCTGTLRPGKVLNISNGRAEWATMRAVVQTVTEDLFSGETVAQLGPPEHLAPQDFVQQQQIARLRPAPTPFPNVQSCAVADPDGSQGDAENGIAPDTIPNPDAGIDPRALQAERDAKNLPRTSGFNEARGLFTKSIPVCEDGELTDVRTYGPET